ncbi:MAG TPA: signal peptidase I [Rhodospirillales bacterium]|nr:signal peptidase I [Rhodospirillales bacterium]
MTRKNNQGFAELVKTLLYAVVIALGVRTVAYEPFNIPSGSMKPTLLVGDYLFVSKFSYGYSRYSLPFSLPLIPGRIFFSEPKRGDVFVFKLPTDNKTDYIKRIIGLPGDRIQVIGGILNINGKPVKRERVDDFMETDSNGNVRRVPQYIETLPNGRKHFILEETDRGIVDNTPVYNVPQGHYFAMGDNRDRSRDSRFIYDVGYIPKKNLVGRADFLFFSIDGSVWEFWKWGRSIRFDRIFNGIY